MNLYAIWLDYAQANIVKANELGEMTVQHLESEVEPKHRSGQSDSEHLTTSDQRANMGRREKEMHEYCDQIIGMLGDADEIVIMGPGVAKKGLEDCIRENHDLAPKLKAVETSDSLSEAELKAKVKEVFGLPRM